jgi:hypothetical protein
MLQGIREKVLRNLGIKATSLFLALLVYAHVYSQQERSTVFEIPLIVEGLPRDLTYRGDVPSHLRVRVRARGGELLKLRTQPARAVVRLNATRAGQFQRPVTTEDVVIPPGSDVRVESIVDPVVLALSIEPLTSRHVPVAVRVRGEPAEGSVVYGPVRAWPETLAVAGPAAVISALDSIWTEEVSLDGRSESFGGTTRVELPDGVRARTDRVTVRVPIVPRSQRSFGPLRVSVPPQLRGEWSIQPESVEVRLSGPKPLIESIAASDLRPRAVPSLPVGSEDVVPVQLGLPPQIGSHVEIEAVEPSFVTLVRRNR